MINENMMFECEWCHADLGSNPKAYDEHVVECPVREEQSHLMHAALEIKYPELYNPPDEEEKS
jgi:hypothetical protein